MEAMASKGETKLRNKVSGMQTSYNAAAGRAQANYAAVGFGPTRTGNYRSAWSYMPGNYAAKVTAGIETKWRTNWLAKMRE